MLSPIIENEESLLSPGVSPHPLTPSTPASRHRGGGRWLTQGAPALEEAMNQASRVASRVRSMASPLVVASSAEPTAAKEKSGPAYWSGWADGEAEWLTEKEGLIAMLEEAQRLANAAVSAPSTGSPAAALDAMRTLLRDEASSRRRHRAAMSSRGDAIATLVAERHDSAKRAKAAASVAARASDNASARREAAVRKGIAALTAKFDGVADAHEAQRVELVGERLKSARLVATVSELRALLAESEGEGRERCSSARRSNAVIAAEVKGEKRIRAVMRLHEQSVATLEDSKRSLALECSMSVAAAQTTIEQLESDAAARHASHAATLEGWAQREATLQRGWEADRAEFEASAQCSAEIEARLLSELESAAAAQLRVPAEVAAFHVLAVGALAALDARVKAQRADFAARERIAQAALVESDRAAVAAAASLRALREDLEDDDAATDEEADGVGNAGGASAPLSFSPLPLSLTLSSFPLAQSLGSRKKRHVRALDSEIATLREAVSERDAEVASVRSAAAARERELWESLTSLLAESEQAAQRHAAQIATRDDEATQLRTMCETLHSRLSAAEKSVAASAASERASSVNHLARLVELHGLSTSTVPPSAADGAARVARLREERDSLRRELARHREVSSAALRTADAADQRWRQVSAAAEADHSAVHACLLRLQRRESDAAAAAAEDAEAASDVATLRRESARAVISGATVVLDDATAQYEEARALVAELREERTECNEARVSEDELRRQIHSELHAELATLQHAVSASRRARFFYQAAATTSPSKTNAEEEDYDANAIAMVGESQSQRMKLLELHASTADTLARGASDRDALLKRIGELESEIAADSEQSRESARVQAIADVEAEVLAMRALLDTQKKMARATVLATKEEVKELSAKLKEALRASTTIAGIDDALARRVEDAVREMKTIGLESEKVIIEQRSVLTNATGMLRSAAERHAALHYTQPEQVVRPAVEMSSRHAAPPATGLQPTVVRIALEHRAHEERGGEERNDARTSQGLAAAATPTRRRVLQPAPQRKADAGNLPGVRQKKKTTKNVTDDKAEKKRRAQHERRCRQYEQRLELEQLEEERTRRSSSGLDAAAAAASDDDCLDENRARCSPQQQEPHRTRQLPAAMLRHVPSMPQHYPSPPPPIPTFANAGGVRGNPYSRGTARMR